MTALAVLCFVFATIHALTVVAPIETQPKPRSDGTKVLIRIVALIACGTMIAAGKTALAQ
jgi:hypothetical protein